MQELSKRDDLATCIAPAINAIRCDSSERTLLGFARGWACFRHLSFCAVTIEVSQTAFSFTIKIRGTMTRANIDTVSFAKFDEGSHHATRVGVFAIVATNLLKQ